MNGSVVASSSGMASNDSDGSNDSVNRSIATGIATGSWGVWFRGQRGGVRFNSSGRSNAACKSGFGVVTRQR